MSFDGDEAGSREYGKMVRHCVVRHIEPPGDLTRRETIRLLFYEQPERLEPGRLREGGEGFDGEVLFHLSGTIDRCCDSQVKVCTAGGKSLRLYNPNPTMGFEPLIWHSASLDKGQSQEGARARKSSKVDSTVGLRMIPHWFAPPRRESSQPAPLPPPLSVFQRLTPSQEACKRYILLALEP